MDGPRSLLSAEFDDLVSTVNEIFRGRPGDQIAEEFPHVYTLTNLSNLKIIKKDGRIISHAGFLPRLASILGCAVPSASVGFVCTRKEERGKGYASLLLRDCMREMERRGLDFLYISGSRDLYLRLGAARAGITHRCTLGRLEAPKGREILVEEALERDAQDLTRLHSQESPRYFRNLTMTKTLLKGAQIRGCRTLVVRRNGHPSSYLSFAIPRSPKGSKVAMVQEYAGSREALLESLSSVMKAFDLDGMTFDVQPHDREFLNVLKKHCSIPPTSRLPEGTVRVLNLPRLIGRLTPALEEKSNGLFRKLKTEPEARGFRLSLGGESRLFSDPMGIADLVFGHPSKEANATAKETRLKLGTLLDHIFPVPLVWSGWDCVLY